MTILPVGYDRMIARAVVALYCEDLDQYERRLVARMVDEGWLIEERGAWTGQFLYRATDKALNRRRR